MPRFVLSKGIHCLRRFADALAVDVHVYVCHARNLNDLSSWLVDRYPFSWTGLAPRPLEAWRDQATYCL